MSTFEPLQRKSRTNSTNITLTSHQRSSRRFAPTSIPTPEHVSPERQTQPTHGSRLRYSLADILILPPAPQDTSEPEADQGPQEGHQLRTRIQAARSGGHRLEKQAQQRLEQELGTDLSGVRIHTDDEADRLTRSVNASAFTTGTNIFFRSGAYQPATLDGLHTLAHEVTHVVQQTRGSVEGIPLGDGLSINDTGDQFEQEAQASADRFSMTTLVQQQITDGFGYSTHSPSSPPLAASQPPSFKGITVK